MSEKNTNERRPEYLDTLEHIVELADEILQQIGWDPAETVSADYPIRAAQWPRKPKQLHFRLERYDFENGDKRYVLNMFVKDESFNAVAIRTYGHGTPYLYQLQDGDLKQVVGDSETAEMRDQLLTVLTNADKDATVNAERRTTDQQFERIIGDYILSELAIRPLDINQIAITSRTAREMTDAHYTRIDIIEGEELRNSRGNKSIDQAIKNKPNPLVNSRFISIDPMLSTAITASQLNGEWRNTIDTTKTPAERIPKVA